MRAYRDAFIAVFQCSDSDGYTDKRGIPAALAVVASEESGTPTAIIRHGLARGSVAQPVAVVTVRESTPRTVTPSIETIVDAQGRTVMLCPKGPELRSWSHQRVRGNGGVRTVVASTTPDPVYSMRVQRTPVDASTRKPSRRAMLVASAAELGASLEQAMLSRDNARAMAVRASLGSVQRELEALPSTPARVQSVAPSAEQASADAEAARHARAQSELDRKAALVAAVKAPTPARDWRGADK